MCEICGKSDCMRCFHSLDEQQEFDNKTGRFAPEPGERPMMLDTDGNRSIFDDVDT